MRRVHVRQVAGRKIKLQNLYHNMIKTCRTGPTKWDKGRKKKKYIRYLKRLSIV
jgi:hypothetical protein